MRWRVCLGDVERELAPGKGNCERGVMVWWEGQGALLMVCRMTFLLHHVVSVSKALSQDQL